MNSTRKLTIFNLLILALAVAIGTVGCAEDSNSIEESASAVVGADGGSIEGQNVTLEIPAGALTDNVEIGVDSTNEVVPDGHTGLSAVYRFSPAGTVFETPVTVRIALDSVPEDGNATIYWTTPDGSAFEAVPTTLDGNVAVAQINHFSRGFVGNGNPIGCASDADCPGGETCQNGVCSRPGNCGAGLVDCAGSCTDVSSDANNCGACGLACASGESCSNGVCSASPACATDSDCAAGEICQSGICTGTTLCPAGETLCSGICADLGSDPANCGACGAACAPAQTCSNGVCSGTNACASDSDCAAGEVCNSGVCVVPPACSSDADCAPTEVCLNGVCSGQQTCPTREIQCGMTCVDPLTDPTNCGACGTACASGQTCVNGACMANGCASDADCATGEVCVNGACTASGCASDADCATGEVCLNGVCQTGACSPGQTQCAGACVDLSSDVNNCGSCGTACPTGNVCISGTCSAANCSTDADCSPMQQCISGRCL